MNREDLTSVLVVGAKGTVGGEATRALLDRGANVRALIRSRSNSDRLRGCELVHGDLNDERAVRRALDGVQAAFYVSPHEPDEERIAERFISACEVARVRLVFVGVHIDATTRLGRALRRFLFGRLLPHYRPKFRIAERARRSLADPIVLIPTNFFQNDEIFRQQIEAGVFSQPFERPINRVDVRDIGVAAARACLDRSLPAGAYPVVGPESLTGDDCARIWAAALGREVNYERDPARASFAAAVNARVSGKKREDFLASYTALSQIELPTRREDLLRTSALLGRPPTSYRDYVGDVSSAEQAAQ